jgi:proline iminopeptidase
MLHGAEHIRRYEETDGKEGHIWMNGAPTLVLTSTGRKSGQQRKTALIYQEAEGNYLVVASDGGAPNHPAWYLNLLAQPKVTVQVAADKFAATARTATAEERAKYWHLMTAVWRHYADYERKTTREIPLVVLEPVRSA